LTCRRGYISFREVQLIRYTIPEQETCSGCWVGVGSGLSGCLYIDELNNAGAAIGGSRCFYIHRRDLKNPAQRACPVLHNQPFGDQEVAPDKLRAGVERLSQIAGRSGQHTLRIQRSISTLTEGKVSSGHTTL
jgi:hypothetical protein